MKRLFHFEGKQLSLEENEEGLLSLSSNEIRALSVGELLLNSLKKNCNYDGDRLIPLSKLARAIEFMPESTDGVHKYMSRVDTEMLRKVMSLLSAALDQSVLVGADKIESRKMQMALDLLHTYGSRIEKTKIDPLIDQLLAYITGK